jgi:hypothetical protein
MLYKNECTNYKPVEITIRKEQRWKGIKTGAGNHIWDIIHIYMEVSQ